MHQVVAELHVAVASGAEHRPVAVDEHGPDGDAALVSTTFGLASGEPEEIGSVAVFRFGEVAHRLAFVPSAQ
jgi:hypothetical protein